MHQNWYIVMHIIYEKVYSLLKLTSKFVVLDDQECVWRHFRSKCHGGGLSGGTLPHPSLENPWSIICEYPIMVCVFGIFEVFGLFRIKEFRDGKCVSEKKCYKLSCSENIKKYLTLRLTKSASDENDDEIRIRHHLTKTIPFKNR